MGTLAGVLGTLAIIGGIVMTFGGCLGDEIATAIFGAGLTAGGLTAIIMAVGVSFVGALAIAIVITIGGWMLVFKAL